MLGKEKLLESLGMALPLPLAMHAHQHPCSSATSSADGKATKKSAQVSAGQIDIRQLLKESALQQRLLYEINRTAHITNRPELLSPSPRLSSNAAQRRRRVPLPKKKPRFGCMQRSTTLHHCPCGRTPRPRQARFEPVCALAITMTSVTDPSPTPSLSSRDCLVYLCIPHHSLRALPQD
ncbi:hypothetical protein BJ546DRAFT_546295 [Cryomyces antarcticus]